MRRNDFCRDASDLEISKIKEMEAGLKRGMARPINGLPCLKRSPTWSNHVQPGLCRQFWSQRSRVSFQPISLRRVSKLTSGPCGSKITLESLGRPQDARDDIGRAVWVQEVPFRALSCP